MAFLAPQSNVRWWLVPKEELIDVKLTRGILSEARVIAKGKRIRDVRRLVAEYGGRASKWVKKSSLRIEIAGEYFELH